jgi:stage III sporulation protein SpoIIIAA
MMLRLDCRRGVSRLLTFSARAKAASTCSTASRIRRRRQRIPRTSSCHTSSTNVRWHSTSSALDDAINEYGNYYNDENPLLFDDNYVDYVEANVEWSTVADLKDICRDLGLKVSGKKLDLQERILAHVDSRKSPAAEILEQADIRKAQLPPQQVQQVAPVPLLIPPNEFCFDRKNEYRLTAKSLMEARFDEDALLSPAMSTVDDTDSLLQLLPEELAQSLDDHRQDLMEVVLDEGRRPFAWINGRRHFLHTDLLTKSQLEAVLQDLHFGADNRAGINGSLHRISALRNRESNFVGATLRVGRYVPGNAIMIADILYRSQLSILFVGPPGSAKTSIIRDAARLLAEEHSVVIVDTSNEIGGAGDIPHECIGLSRRMQVPNIGEQARIMVECVQNHTPSVMVIDEIGRPAEVAAALTCKERGVRMIASAHGTLPGLVRNAALCDLVGGVDIVTVGDKTARSDAKHRGGTNKASASKLRAERKAPPIFDVVVELQRGFLHEWQIVLNSAAAVDSILKMGMYEAEIRTRDPKQNACIQVRRVKHDINRNQILEEQRQTSHQPSAMNRTMPVLRYDEDAEDEDAEDVTRKPKSNKCPSCNRTFSSRRSMLDHALNKSKCSEKLSPADELNFTNERWPSDGWA